MFDEFSGGHVFANPLFRDFQARRGPHGNPSGETGRASRPPERSTTDAAVAAGLLPQADAFRVLSDQRPNIRNRRRWLKRRIHQTLAVDGIRGLLVKANVLDHAVRRAEAQPPAKAHLPMKK